MVFSIAICGLLALSGDYPNPHARGRKQDIAGRSDITAQDDPRGASVRVRDSYDECLGPAVHVEISDRVAQGRQERETTKEPRNRRSS
jgi:hypothetical protein